MTPARTRRSLLAVAHGMDHFLMLVFASAALTIAGAWDMEYAALVPWATPAFIAFGLGALPAGWLADRWSREGMLTVFFIGAGASCLLTAQADTPMELAVGLTAIGLFAAIYHPVGLAMVIDGEREPGFALAVNGVWGNLGVALAALVTGVLLDLGGWRMAFVVPGVVTLLCGWACAVGWQRGHLASTWAPVAPGAAAMHVSCSARDSKCVGVPDSGGDPKTVGVPDSIRYSAQAPELVGVPDSDPKFVGVPDSASTWAPVAPGAAAMRVPCSAGDSKCVGVPDSNADPEMVGVPDSDLDPKFVDVPASAPASTPGPEFMGVPASARSQELMGVPDSSDSAPDSAPGPELAGVPDSAEVVGVPGSAPEPGLVGVPFSAPTTTSGGQAYTSRGVFLRALAVIAALTVLGGFVFQSTTFALPAIMDERLAALGGSSSRVGAWTALVFTVAAFAQLVSGRLVDRFEIRSVLTVTVAMQAVLFGAMPWVSGTASLVLATGFMLLVFGQIPIVDLLVGRIAAPAWRSRAYAISYAAGFTVTAGAVPLVATLHASGGFDRLFLVLAAMATLMTAASLALPTFRPAEALVRSSASSGRPRAASPGTSPA